MKEIDPPYVPTTRQPSDVSNVDPEFLAETPEETPVLESALAAMASEEGDFDNFTFINKHNLSELGTDSNYSGSKLGPATRPSTEVPNMKASFAHSAVESDSGSHDEKNAKDDQSGAVIRPRDRTEVEPKTKNNQRSLLTAELESL